LAVALLYVFQEKILYVPKLPGVPDDYSIPPDRYGLASEDVTFTTRDKIRLHAWFLYLPHWTPEFMRTRPVVLFFQENAGNMSFRLPYLRLMIHRLNCPVFAVSYRGYGLSKGRPNEKGLMEDALAGLEALRGRTDVDTGRVVVYGRSLGGAVALHLAARAQDRVAALIVENTFYSVEDMVARVVPPLGAVIGTGKPLNFLVTNKWHNWREIPKITRTPLLMLVSDQDEMVPADQMYKLHALQRAPACELVSFPHAHHMDAYDVDPDAYWGALKAFMAAHVERHPDGRNTAGDALSRPDFVP